MESGISSLLSISVDFENSHLFFPTIISWIMAVLFAIVLVAKVAPFLVAVKRGERSLPIVGEPMDGWRFSARLR